MASGEPRIAPGRASENGRINFALAGLIGIVSGDGRPPNLFTTLGRHRRLFRPWLRFAGRLMPGGSLRRAETELVILRVAENCRCEYELRHHRRLAEQAGLTAEQIERVAAGPDAAGWTPRQIALLEAADCLHRERDIPDPVWRRLSACFNQVELIEVCMLIGHYEMLAMTLNALRVEPDPEPDPGAGSWPARLARRVTARRVAAEADSAPGEPIGARR